MKIILADDDPLFRSAMCRILKKAGYEVKDFSNGRDAIAELQANKPDLVITDVMMPHALGDEVLHYAKECKVPVVIVSIISDGNYISQLFSSGLEDYIKKPIDYLEFLARIKKILKN